MEGPLLPSHRSRACASSASNTCATSWSDHQREPESRDMADAGRGRRSTRRTHFRGGHAKTAPPSYRIDVLIKGAVYLVPATANGRMNE